MDIQNAQNTLNMQLLNMRWVDQLRSLYNLGFCACSHGSLGLNLGRAELELAVWTRFWFLL